MRRANVLEGLTNWCGL